MSRSEGNPVDLDPAGLAHNNASKGRRNSSRSYKEKRKSDVLIAAQSLDNELQNVKNLKRLSIGSMDLLIDPELEYRIQSPYGGQTHDEMQHFNDAEEFEDEGNSFFDDSINITSTEYLQDPPEILEEPHDKLTKSGDEKVSARKLSGVRRGGIHSAKSRASSDDYDSEESVTQNLLWVPANQHPNIRPENYLELVQDTLQNLQLEQEELSRTGTKEHQNQSLARNPGLGKSINKNSSLVRRPSRLRKSYSEFEELHDMAHLSDEPNNDESLHDKTDKRGSGLKEPHRVISLRDITEELTKVSNKAGLTDGDAVTLARTLGMAGPYENEAWLGDSSECSSEAGDSAFASTMMAKGGLTIPERSSLRRSKFNTYRIRSSDKSSSHSSKEHAHQPSSASQLSAATPQPNSEHTPEAPLDSPSSVNDVNDIYDHYRSASLDNMSELSVQDGSLASPSITKSSMGHKDKPLDLDATRTSHLKPSRRLQDTKLSGNTVQHENTEMRRSSDEGSKTPSDEKPKKRKGGWNWFNKKQLQNQETDSHETRPRAHSVSNDFLNVAKDSKVATLPGKKVNHSRHRHYSIDSNEDKNTGEKQTATSSDMHEQPSPIKKPKRDKFINLFKKRTGSSSSHATESTRDHEAGDVKHNETKNIFSETNFTPERSTGHKTEAEALPQRGSQEAETTKTDTQTTLKPHLNVTPKKRTTATNSSVHAGLEETVSETQQVPHVQLSDKALPANGVSKSEQLTNLEPASPPEKALETATTADEILPARKLAFSDVKKPGKPNAPMKFTDSAFGFPLPPLTISTVIMIDQRLPINVERAIYRLSHLKLSDAKRELRQQVQLSNFMYAYLNLVNHSLYLQQLEEDRQAEFPDGQHQFNGQNHSQLGQTNYASDENRDTISIPDI